MLLHIGCQSVKEQMTKLSELFPTDLLPADPVQPQYNFWLSLVDKLGVKAFVDLTLSPSVRQGTQHLLRITGLGKTFPDQVIFLTRSQKASIRLDSSSLLLYKVQVPSQ